MSAPKTNVMDTNTAIYCLLGFIFATFIGLFSSAINARWLTKWPMSLQLHIHDEIGSQLILFGVRLYTFVLSIVTLILVTLNEWLLAFLFGIVVTGLIGYQLRSMFVHWQTIRNKFNKQNADLLSSVSNKKETQDSFMDSKPVVTTDSSQNRNDPLQLEIKKEPLRRSSYNTKNIRAFLLEGFTDEALRHLCYDNPPFRPVYEKFGSAMSKNQVIQELLDYAERRDLMETLLTITKEANPAKYEMHQPYYRDIPSE